MSFNKWHYLSPVFEKVLSKSIFCGVLMIKHFGKKCGHLLCRGAQFERLTYGDGWEKDKGVGLRLCRLKVYRFQPTQRWV